jgi:hypothetical protein
LGRIDIEGPGGADEKASLPGSTGSRDQDVGICISFSIIIPLLQYSILVGLLALEDVCVP